MAVHQPIPRPVHPQPVDDPGLTLAQLKFSGWKEGAPPWADTSEAADLCAVFVCGGCDSRGLALVVFHNAALERWRAFGCCGRCGNCLEM